ncbi:fungal specific transcription factor domain-containing protein [Aspergillus alliaceus]|uniref:fungal specific transcription factor domain-containing protein n=1 Tax=Petromyces alliaceus TaxID=209559 RepID=UPI0012A6492B|nr:fungal-specific transcription factor domain-containing protein [Aspergillus alliaceus]KAB8238630.1 fungal-specific transcription factor domain-containing protein [Aspergillus alliaceus]
MWAEPLKPSAEVFQQAVPPKRRRVSLSPSLSACSLATSVEQPSPNSTLSSGYMTIPSTPSEYGAIELHTPRTEEKDPNESDDLALDLTHDNDFTIIAPKPRCALSHLSNLETHYLQYHMELGSKLLANLESDENPLRSLIIPRALSSPLLMKALCAVSAMHFANRSRDSLGAQTAAANYYVRTMSGLRSALSNCPVEALSTDSVLAVALLCKYEIVRGSVKQWAVHLNALEKLVVSRGGFSTFDHETAEFLWGLFMYAHNVARVTNRKQITNHVPGMETFSLTKLDIYIGYTEDIIKLCPRIADLPLLSHDPVALGLEIHTIDTLLRNWTYTSRQYIIPKGITDGSLLRLRMVAECFRDAAYIYLHSTLERMSQSSMAHNLPSLWSSFISRKKPVALRRCLDRIQSFHLDENCEYSALTFPLFIAGCESESPAERELVSQSLGKLEMNFGIGNVKRAKELLNILWSGEKMHWLDVLERLKWDLILA